MHEFRSLFLISYYPNCFGMFYLVPIGFQVVLFTSVLFKFDTHIHLDDTLGRFFKFNDKKKKKD